MGNAVEDRATPERCNARLAGLALVAISTSLWAAVALCREWTREVLLAPLVGDYEAEFTRALALDATAMALIAGLVLLGTRVPMAVLVAIVVSIGRAIDHVAVAQQSAWTLGIDDERWRVAGVDAPHLAAAVAVAAALLRVAAIARGGGSPALARQAQGAAVVWPLVASAVVGAKAFVGGFERWVEIATRLPLLVAAAAEAVLAVATLAIAARAGRQIWLARREAIRRHADGVAAIGPADRDDCARCGYDLTGLHGDAACPECGLGVERSRTTSTQLRDAPPEWLRDVAIGAAILCASMAIAIAWPFSFDEWLWPRIATLGGGLLGPTIAGWPVDVGALRNLPTIVACAAIAVALWLITRPPRREPGDETLRWSLRAIAFAPVVATFVLFLNDRLNGGSRAIGLAATALLTVGCAPIPGLAFALLRRLALRALDARLAEHATIVGVGFAVSLVALPLTFAAADVSDGGSWVRRSPATLAAMSAATVVFVFFAGWATLTCGRCAVAFGRAARAARSRWEEADRGIVDLGERSRAD